MSQEYFKEIPTSFQTTRPFKIYKTWNLNASDYLKVNPSSGSISIYDAVANYNNNLINEYSTGSESGSIWYSINHMFYDIVSAGLPPYYGEFTEHNLSGSAIVFSIPQSKFGEQILPSSFKFSSGSKLVVDDGKGNLYDFTNNTSSIGNISYSRGLIIFTDSTYYTLLSSSYIVGTPSGIIEYTSYYTAYENEFICSAKSYEFNGTYNPSAYTTNQSGDSLFKFNNVIDSSGSQVIFKPLVTSIGLYDNTNQLVAIAKFARPIRMETDFDSIFIIRFDT